MATSLAGSTSSSPKARRCGSVGVARSGKAWSGAPGSVTPFSVSVPRSARGIADVERLGFDDRLAMPVEREVAHRDRKSCPNNLHQAQLRIRADVRDVDCSASRGIARSTLTRLAAGDWIRQGINLIVEGPTGSGKTFLVCALAHQACHQKMSVPGRIVHNAYRIELTSGSQRRRNAPPPLDGGGA